MPSKEPWICAICNREFRNKFIQHIQTIHGLGKKDYYDMYMKKGGDGKCLFCGKETAFRYGKHAWKYADFCDNSCKYYWLWQQPDYVRGQQEHGRKVMTKNWESAEWTHKMAVAVSQGQRRYWNDPNLGATRRESRSLQASQQLMELDSLFGRGRVKRVTYRGVTMHSGYEVKFARFLDRHHVVWSRGDLRFQYRKPDGSLHWYTPDFLLPNHGIVVETKSSYYYKGFETHYDRLRELIEDDGYHYVLMLEDNWDDIENMIRVYMYQSAQRQFSKQNLVRRHD